jgi:hypothetical protein
LDKIDLFSLKSSYAVQIKMKTEKYKVYSPRELQTFLDEYVTQCKLNNVTLDLSLFDFNTAPSKSIERLYDMLHFMEYSPVYNSKFYVEKQHVITLPNVEQVRTLAFSKFHSSLEEYFIPTIFQPFVEIICCFIPLAGYVLLLWRMRKLCCTVQCLYSKIIKYV